MSEIPPYTVIIPARYDSSRLPGKPLVVIAGKPMIWHVYQRAQESHAERIVIATDDERIRGVAEDFGASVIMTRHDHESGTDRLAEAVIQLGLDEQEIVVNLQGDEPLMPPRLLDQVALSLHSRQDASVASLMTPIKSLQEFQDPACVKVVCDAQGHALYFSRAPIPVLRDGSAEAIASLAMRHLGVYAYRCRFLREFATMPPCELEQLEKLEQLRVLYHGRKIIMDVVLEMPPVGVDTLDDLQRVSKFLTGEKND
ncbi:MAG TPA: 3-deoxy-manno-octulosonate cytidylyltransferase [Halothiobacillus sp.]|nr:3-deoxy-manno-octulosonate cytidylyltransferase [Halothiobacillus sp.]